MAASNPVHHCRIYQNGNSRSVYLDQSIAKEIKDDFPPDRDYSAFYDPDKKTIMIFEAKPPI